MRVLNIYVDGSTVPNPGTTGYGMHMVIGNDEVKHKKILNKWYLTDQGYLDKKPKNETLLGLEGGVDIYGYNITSKTNNHAEVDAVIHAVEFIPTIEKEFGDIDKINIISDSTYTLGYLKKILNNKLNMDDIEVNKDKIEKLLNTINKTDIDKINLIKIKAHNGNLGNERADMLANMGRIKQHREEDEFNFYIGKKDFWKDPDIDSDIFFFKQLFTFGYMDINKIPKTYYGFNYKKETEVGKKISQVSYNIIETYKEYDEVNDILESMMEAMDDIYRPFVVNLTNLYNKNIIRDIIRFGSDYLLTKGKGKIVIKTINGIDIATEIYPPAASVLTQTKLEEFYSDFQRSLANHKEYTLIDITNEIYSKDKKGKLIIKPEFKNDKFRLKIKYDKTTVKVNPKYDLPPRNTLARYAKKDPKVTLVIKDHGELIEYFTIIKLEDGEEFIATVNPYANKIIKKTR